MTTSDRLLTIEEFEAQYSRQRVELVRGVPQEMSPTSDDHGRLSMAIGFFLLQYVMEHGPGGVRGAETGFILSNDPAIMRAADAAFISSKNLDRINDPSRFVPFAPDLAIEVVSPSDKAADIKAEVNEYLTAGTGLVWVIYPEQQQIDIFTASGQTETLGINDTLTGGNILPDFILPLKRLFEVK